MGTTNLDPFQIREFMERQSATYNGDSYHLIVKNCNHFCEDICYKLTGNSIPKWVNRLARIGILSHVFKFRIRSFVLDNAFEFCFHSLVEKLWFNYFILCLDILHVKCNRLHILFSRLADIEPLPTMYSLCFHI